MTFQRDDLEREVGQAPFKGAGGDEATSDRKGRDGVNPSSTHLLVKLGKTCRRGASPLATLAVAGSRATKRALKFAPIQAAPPRLVRDWCY